MARQMRLLACAVGVAVVVAVPSLFLLDHSGSALPADVQSRLGLAPLDGRLAPAFALTDQRGKRIDPAALRGRQVVLGFMDPVCSDICPIVSQEFVEAARLLGPAARQAAFVAVNVNQYHERLADVRRFSRAHGLDDLPAWHFVTGTTPQLQALWKAYGVEVQPNSSGDVVHSSPLYFIDARGRERYLGWPGREQRVIAAWSRGIAAVVESIAR